MRSFAFALVARACGAGKEERYTDRRVQRRAAKRTRTAFHPWDGQAVRTRVALLPWTRLKFHGRMKCRKNGREGKVLRMGALNSKLKKRRHVRLLA